MRVNKIDIRKFARIAAYVIALVFALFVIVATLVFFQHKVENMLFGKNIQHINELQQLYTELVHNKFEDHFLMLDTLSRSFEDTDAGAAEKNKQLLRYSVGSGEFKKLALYYSDGTGIDSNGKHVPSMRNSGYFKKAIENSEKTVSDRIELDSNLEPTLTLLAPVRGRKDIILRGTIPYSLLKNMFDISVFSGKSYSYIINSEGTVILCNKDKNRNLYNVDFYDYLKTKSTVRKSLIQKMRIDIMNGRSGHIITENNKEGSIMSFRPMNINGWYIITVVPVSYISRQQNDISLLVYIVISVVALMLILIIMVAFFGIKRSLQIEKDNERLTIANNQAQTLIFEYDIQKDIVEFSGETKFIIGTEKKLLSAEFIRGEHFKRIHPDDGNILEHLDRAIKNKLNTFTAEFRFKNYENEYIWVRMTGSCIFSESGFVRKFIGSITNVNSQVLHEQELINLAERDKLSNLLNKVTFEHKIRQYILEQGDVRICALIIIDLDNFKSVNDYLGHLTGDMAIKDAAKKLSIVFSDKDFICRFGGDEFCIFMRFSDYLSKEKVIQILNEKGERLCSLLKEDYFNEDSNVTVTASIGMAVFPSSGKNYEELFNNADKALYQVKHNGKNGFSIYKNL